MNTIRLLLPAAVLAAAMSCAAHADTTPAAAAAASGVPAAHAWHGRHGGIGHVLRQLNLSADQKAQVQSIFAQAKPQLRALRTNLRSTHDLLSATAPTDAGYATLLAAAQSGAAARVQLRSDVWSQIYAILTPAQQAAIPGILAAEHAKRDARRAAWQQQHPAA